MNWYELNMFGIARQLATKKQDDTGIYGVNCSALVISKRHRFSPRFFRCPTSWQMWLWQRPLQFYWPILWKVWQTRDLAREFNSQESRHVSTCGDRLAHPKKGSILGLEPCWNHMKSPHLTGYGKRLQDPTGWFLLEPLRSPLNASTLWYRCMTHMTTKRPSRQFWSLVEASPDFVMFDWSMQFLQRWMFQLQFPSLPGKCPSQDSQGADSTWSLFAIHCVWCRELCLLWCADTTSHHAQSAEGVSGQPFPAIGLCFGFPFQRAVVPSTSCASIGGDPLDFIIYDVLIRKKIILFMLGRCILLEPVHGSSMPCEQFSFLAAQWYHSLGRTASMPLLHWTLAMNSRLSAGKRGSHKEYAYLAHIYCTYMYIPILSNILISII